MQEKEDPLDYISYSPPSSSLRGAPCHQAPRSMAFLDICLSWQFPQSRAVTRSGCIYVFRGISICRNNIQRTESLVLLLKVVLKSSGQQKTLQPQILSQCRKRTFHGATRAALSKMCSRVEELKNRQDQTPELALISFL